MGSKLTFWNFETLCDFGAVKVRKIGKKYRFLQPIDDPRFLLNWNLICVQSYRADQDVSKNTRHDYVWT